MARRKVKNGEKSYWKISNNQSFDETMHDVVNMEKGILLLCTRRFDSSREGVGHLPIVIKSPTGLSLKFICIITVPAFPG